MNKMTHYKNRFQEIEEAKKIVKDKETAFTEAFQKQINEYLWVIHSVSQKMNRKKSLPTVTHPRFRELPWRWDGKTHRAVLSPPTSYIFEQYSVKILWERTYRSGREEKKSVMEFVLLYEYLSISTWDLASHIRKEFRKLRDEELKNEALKKRKEAAKEWRKAVADVQRLMQEAKDYEKTLKKLEIAEANAKKKLEEVEEHALVTS